MATIDVLLPVKNGIDYFSESLDSICNQTFTDWRLLVLDHGSTDGSLELAKHYQARDSRIQVHSFPDAIGLSGLLNQGLALADCSYVMRHDADDVAMPDRMLVTLNAFKRNPDVVVISGQAIIIDASGKVTGMVKTSVGRDWVTASTFFRNPIIHPAAMMDFSAIKKLGVSYGADFLNVLPKAEQISVSGLAEDYFMFGQLAILGKCMNIENVLIKYRLHGSNVGIMRFSEQMDLSLNISRNLAKSFCAIHKLNYFDPAPFCSHGGILFEIEGQSDFSKEFEYINTIFRITLGQTSQLERELAYRRVVATRSKFKLLLRYFIFRSKNKPVDCEWSAVKSWVINHFISKNKVSIAAQYPTV